MDRHRPRLARNRRLGLDREENARFADLKTDVAPRRQRHAENPLTDVVEVDPDVGRPGRRRSRLRLRFIALGGLGLRRLGAFLLVALGSERRRQILGEHGQIDAARDRPGEAADVRLQRRTGVGRRGEVQILPVAVEHRLLRVAHAVGDLRGFAGCERVHVNGAQIVREPSRIRQPFRVGRPHRHPVVAEVVPVGLLADLYRLALLDVDVPDPHVRVDECDLLRVRGPLRRTIEARLGHRDLRHLADSGLRREVQRVFAGFVGEIRAGFAVRRVGGLPAPRHRQLLGEAAIHVHRLQVKYAHIAVAIGRKQDLLAVRRPAECGVRRRVPREPFRHPASGRDGVDVDVAVVFAGEPAYSMPNASSTFPGRPPSAPYPELM